MQLAPDLFTWRSRGIPLDLQYRYTPRVRPDQFEDIPFLAALRERMQAKGAT